MRLDRLNYADQAEQVVEELLQSGHVTKLSTSKMRAILMMISQLYTDAMHTKGDTLPSEIRTSVQHTRIRLIYESGKDPLIKKFTKNAELLELIAEIGDSRERLIVFCKYVEALVAYHEYYGTHN